MTKPEWTTLRTPPKEVWLDLVARKQAYMLAMEQKWGMDVRTLLCLAVMAQGNVTGAAELLDTHPQTIGRYLRHLRMIMAVDNCEGITIQLFGFDPRRDPKLRQELGDPALRSQREQLISRAMERGFELLDDESEA